MTPTAAIVAPTRSLEQRRAALEKANWVRSERARLKRDLKARRVTVGQMLVQPPEFLETAKVFDVLIATPKVGRVKATKLLDRAKVSPSKTVGGLTDRQRAELRALIGGRW